MNNNLLDQFEEILVNTDDNDLAAIVASIEGRMEMGKHYTQEAIADNLSDLDLRRDLQDYDRLEDLFAQAVVILRVKAERGKPYVKPQDILKQLQQIAVKSRQVDDCDAITPIELLEMQSAISELDGFVTGYRNQFITNYAAK